LQEELQSLESEKQDSIQQLEGSEIARRTSQEENERLMKELCEIKEEKESLSTRVTEQESLLVSLKEELKTVSYSCEEYKHRCDDLLVQLTTKEYEVTEKKELEHSEIRRSLQAAERELAELQRWRQDALTKLSQENEAKLKLEAQVSELQNVQKQLMSDVEDRDIESHVLLEDMRKERAELKTKLKETEKEAAELKESLSNFQGKFNTEKREKQSLTEKFQSQHEELLSNTMELTSLRSDLCEMLQSFGRSKDLPPLPSSNDFAPSNTDSISAAMKELETWKSCLPVVLEEIAALHRSTTKLSDVESELENLNGQISEYEMRESDNLKQLEDERLQNEKLFSLLRQAEQEMERSTVQIREMSESMARLQEREHDANKKIQTAESDLTELRGEFEKHRVEKKEELERMKRALSDNSAKLEEKESQLMQSNSRVDSLTSDLEQISYQLRSKEAEEKSLKSTIQSLENKTARLRDYIRKLTTKCEEWEVSYDKQSLAVEKLQEKNARIREKASEFACRYRKLAGDVQRRKRMHSEDRARWSHERSNLNEVHIALEHELELIARELSIPVESAEH